jgi:hypothetical protein
LKSQKKILIVENLMHFWQVDDIYKIFSKNFNCHVILPRNFKHIPKLKKNIISSHFRYFIYLHVLFIGRKYDYIYLCSCPEYPDYPNNFKNFLIYVQQLLIFILLIIFFRKKIITYVRGLHRIFPDVHENYIIKFFIYLRYKIFQLLNIFVFENKNLAQIFESKFKKKKIKLTTIYTRYYDKNLSYKKNFNKNLIIGILGAIDPIRKDYNLFLSNLFEHRDLVSVKFLGRYYKNLSEKVIESFKGFNIEYQSNFINEQDFLKIGKECNILISLNKEEKYYGHYKGTGSFGDAMYLQKALIIPSFTDPINEFSDFCYYYKDYNDFKLLIQKILNREVNLDAKFDNFDLDNCSKKIFNDLNI